MAKRGRTTIQGISINDIDYDDEPEIVKVKYENYYDVDNEEQPIQIEEQNPEYNYVEEFQEDDGSSAQFVITELGELTDPDMLALKPIKKPDPVPSSSFRHFCSVCGKGFQYLRAYNQHRMVHVLRSDHTTCKICHKELKRTALEYHMKYRHIDARNYQCEVCLNRFKSPGALRHHIATFHQRAGFDCDECERVFRTRDLMLKHKDEDHGNFFQNNFDYTSLLISLFYVQFPAHKPVKIEKFDCEFCNKSFPNQGQLTLHIGILGKKLGKCRDS